jgi:hypothetical protein
MIITTGTYDGDWWEAGSMEVKGSARGSRGDDENVVVRKAEHGWVVGGQEVSDLTSAMVLADLFAADEASRGTASTRPEQAIAEPDRPNVSDTPKPRFVPKQKVNSDEAARLAITVTQLEHALASRVRVEQAIGVLAERHRLRPREAFDLLRGAARSRGQRITEMAEDVVASTANPLLRLPDELARQAPASKQHGRGLRRARHA